MFGSCPRCGWACPVNAASCPRCGQLFQRAADPNRPVEVNNASGGSIACQRCGESCPVGATFCAGCGQPLNPNQYTSQPMCPRCGMAHSLGDVFCKCCGQQLSGCLSASVAVAPPEITQPERKPSFWRQLESGLGILLIICGVFYLMAALDGNTGYQSGSSDPFGKLILCVFSFVFGYALFRSGRGKAIRIEALRKRDRR